MGVLCVLGMGSTAASVQARPIDYATPDGDRCDFIDPAVCLQPFPNDYFTAADPTTDTGRRVNLNLLSMPANRAGKHIDPSDINRNDGFGPGSPIVTRVPGLDNAQAFQRTGSVPITDLARTYDRNQPVVVINTRTGRRQLIWTEIDSNPGEKPQMYRPCERIVAFGPSVTRRPCRSTVRVIGRP